MGSTGKRVKGEAPSCMGLDAIQKALHIQPIADDAYTLGVFCGKIGMVMTVVYQLKSLRKQEGARYANFMKGVEDSSGVPLSDIGYEMSLVRGRRPDLFDVLIRERLGSSKAVEVQEAIDNARYWETPKQVKVAQDLLREATEARLSGKLKRTGRYE